MKYVVHRHYEIIGTFTRVKDLREFLMLHDSRNAKRYENCTIGYSNNYGRNWHKALNCACVDTEYCSIHFYNKCDPGLCDGEDE